MAATWSVVLYPGASYLHPSGQSPLCITSIRFKDGARLTGTGRSVVKVAYDNSADDYDDDQSSSSECGIAEVVVAALTPNKITRASTNFELTDDVDFVSLSVTGENAVEIVGHYIIDEDEEDEEEEVDCFEDAMADDPYDLVPDSPHKYDELFKHLESVLDAGLLAKNPGLLKTVFGVANTPPPDNAFWTDDPFNYDFLAESPTQYPPGTTFLPDKPLARSSPAPAPLDDCEEMKPFNRYELPPHLRPPTPPTLPASAAHEELPTCAGMDWCATGELFLTHVKAEDTSDELGADFESALAQFASDAYPTLQAETHVKMAGTLEDVLGAEVMAQVAVEMRPRPNKRQREERARSYWRALAIGF